jgi:hypothetical protein
MTVSEWSYAGIVEPEGATLYGILHDSHVFCEKVGLIKCYAETRSSDGSVFAPFDLGTEGMTVGDQLIYRRTSSRTPDRHYRMSHRMQRDFRINDLIGSGQRLLGRQFYAFTETANTPRHETVGVAAAGRFYPTIDFEIPAVSDPAAEAVTALRFDYWIEPDLGAGGRRTPNVILPGLDFLLTGIDHLMSEDVAEPTPQQAALFRDRDHGVLTRLWNSGGLGAPGEQIFIGAEKPLNYEVATTGIRHGGRRGWDNIHSWGYSSRGLPSTPGMPYGVHLHWRWSAGATNPAAMLFGDWTPDFARDPTLAGRDIQGNMVPGGPLIDPRTPDTDLRIAVVKKETAEAFKTSAPDTMEEFERTFRRIKSHPDDIQYGDRLVFIISIIQRRPNRRRTWRSLVFPHGFFFPHVYDTGYVNEAAITMAGAYSPQYLPRRPTRTWVRNAPRG